MKESIKKRVLEEANIIINTKGTIRDLTKVMNVSKSTIHNDMQERLRQLDEGLYFKVLEVFKEHISIRHYLGGIATKKKYKKVI